MRPNQWRTAIIAEEAGTTEAADGVAGSFSRSRLTKGARQVGLRPLFFGTPRGRFWQKPGTEKLEAVRLRCIKPIIDALMRVLTHVLFGLQCGCERTVGGHGVKALIEIHMTFPCP